MQYIFLEYLNPQGRNAILWAERDVLLYLRRCMRKLCVRFVQNGARAYIRVILNSKESTAITTIGSQCRRIDKEYCIYLLSGSSMHMKCMFMEGRRTRSTDAFKRLRLLSSTWEALEVTRIPDLIHADISVFFRARGHAALVSGSFAASIDGGVDEED